MNILVGDIGGTKTILAVFSSQTGVEKCLVEMNFLSNHYDSLEDIIKEFLAKVELPVDRACFCVAGPVVNCRSQITNLKWVVDALVIQSKFNLSTVTLLNDLEAMAYAIPILKAEDIFTLNVGEPIAGGSIAVLAPGTGLGEGFLTCKNGQYSAHASEGSHVSFAPVGALQMGLLTFMNQQGFDHVSFERVCSGGLGIPYLYAYLKNKGITAEPKWIADQLMNCEDPSPVIFNAAQDPARKCELATATLDLFVAILGAEAGNLALKVLSTGGIYLGGGIPPRILKELQKPAFLEALQSKGRFRTLLTNMPVHVILNPKPGLLGAAAHGFASPLS